jgi:hypothetical protein
VWPAIALFQRISRLAAVFLIEILAIRRVAGVVRNFVCISRTCCPDLRYRGLGDFMVVLYYCHMAKLTFSLDDETVRTLRRVAELKRKPQSLVVREAIVEYAAREDTLADDERARRLNVLRDLQSQPPTRPQKDVEREISDLRRDRKTGWTRASD